MKGFRNRPNASKFWNNNQRMEFFHRANFYKAMIFNQLENRNEIRFKLVSLKKK